MRRTVPLLLGMALACMLSLPAAGQDFGQLLKAVERMETDLKVMIEQESQARVEADAQLRAELAGSGAVADPTLAATVESLAQEVNRLHNELNQLMQSQETDQPGSTEMAQLVTEILLMKSEIADLRRNSGSRGPQYVSTDEGSFAAAFGEPAPSGPAWSGLDITGFFDVVAAHQSSVDDHTQYGLGQAEIDIESELSSNAAIAVAVAYNNETGNFELGAAEIGVSVFSADEGFLNSIEVVAGQFDVPFGVDYHVYPSIDRKLVTVPRAVDLPHGGWNDFGVRYCMDAQYGNFVIYGVNGFESSAEVLDEVETLATGEDTYMDVDTSPATAFGTRLGIAPFEWLEIGSSFAFGINASDRNEMTIVGADLQFSMFNFELKSEYISHSLNRSIAREDNKGYYVQGAYSFGSTFIVSRYGSFQPDGADWIGQFSLGAGYAVTDGIELRFETLVNEVSDDNQNILQLVAGF